MVPLLLFLLNLLGLPLKSTSRLAAENAALRQQVIVLQRKIRGRMEFTDHERLFFIQLYRWFPSVRNAIKIIRPATLVRWHRAGFRRCWRWKSRNLGGRPRINAALRALIQQMSMENVLWGAPRIRGELLKLGFAVAQSTIARYMIRPDNRAPSGQRWDTFVLFVSGLTAVDLHSGERVRGTTANETRQIQAVAGGGRLIVRQSPESHQRAAA